MGSTGKATASLPGAPARLASVLGESAESSVAPRVAPPPSRRVRREHEEAAKIDESIFDYDGVYDRMKQIEREQRQAKRESDKEYKPKYMNQFFASAEIRERDKLRAEAKMIQRQREAEGEEYAGKEAFVTSAYKEQQESLARAEAEERLREERDRQKSGGAPSFYRNMLQEESAKREAALAALQETPKEAVQETTEQTDRDIAADAAKRGLRVELNDDNEIIDRRQLLTKGLNVLRKRKADDADAPRSVSEAASEAAPSDRALRSKLMEEALLAQLDSDDED
ncbi:hypothetical protein MCUN1_000604 [Malassezia cuniculi]|uniref:Nuclear speckle splicing regulatory protein 1 N-terminal domain-containing protein n=1 Tax=Malassezia cuniculi TaxID=948313 RepID=A0AAF0EVQ7_9BASI|nr:hypothetical protein MCUN1_000604 [Malassezia cuniculi]